MPPTKPKLARGGRQMVDQLLADLADIRATVREVRDWNKRREPIDVERLLVLLLGDRTTPGLLDALEERITGDLEPMLQRREEQRREDDSLAELRREVEAIKAQLAGPQAPAPDLRIVSKGGRAGS